MIALGSYGAHYGAHYQTVQQQVGGYGATSGPSLAFLFTPLKTLPESRKPDEQLNRLDAIAHFRVFAKPKKAIAKAKFTVFTYSIIKAKPRFEVIQNALLKLSDIHLLKIEFEVEVIDVREIAEIARLARIAKHAADMRRSE